MEMRQVPGTDIKVSPICLGTMTYGTPVAKEDAIRLTHLAIDVGINFIDTANMYEGYNRTIGSPGGVAGQGYSGHRRDTEGAAKRHRRSPEGKFRFKRPDSETFLKGVAP